MIVYKITNKINNKFYIGITSKPIEHRFSGHINQPRFYLGEAIKKYGEQNFIIEKIDTAQSFDKLKKLEQYYINKLKPEYNLTKGGDGTVGIKHSNSFKKMRRKKMLGNIIRKGLTFTQIQRQKISQSLKGNSNKLGKTGPQENPFTGQRQWLIGNKNVAKRPDVREKLRLAALKREAKKRELKKVI